MISCIVFVAYLGLFPARAVHAAGIVVTTLDDNTNVNSLCSLREAITNANANSDTTSGDCAAGNGADTITFNVSGTILLGSSLPEITDAAGLTIDGSGHSVTISGQNAGSARMIDILHDTVSLTLRALTIAHGNAPEAAGVHTSGTLTLDHMTFSENHAQYGGAVEVLGGTAMVTDSTFSQNSADYGGAIYHGGGTVTVTNSTFSGNTADGSGGAISTVGGTLTIVNSTFSGNTANQFFGGGAIENDASTLTVINSTFSGNNGVNGGGAIAHIKYSAGNPSTTITNSILANSTNGEDCRSLTGGFHSGGHNLVEAPGTCTFTAAGDVTGHDPTLGSLARNGGSTQTAALLPGSLAIDAGDDATCTATGSGAVGNKDQRGTARTGFGPHCDIGAFESQGFTLTPVGGSTPQSTIDTTAFPNPLAVTVTSSHDEPVNGGQVTFTPNPGASGQSATVTTNPMTIAGGVASVAGTANNVVGSYTVTASAAGATSVAFTLTNTLGPANALTPNPTTPQSAPVSTAFAPLTVTVTDVGGNRVADGTTMTFTVTPAGSGARATLSNGGTATTTGGVATITATANTIAGGPYTVTATSNGHTATFTLTNTPGPASTVTVTDYPASVVSGTAHTFTATARDQFNNIVPGYTGTVTFTSIDTHATLPANYTFTAADAGAHQFSATFGSAGTRNLTATDTTSSITGTQAGITVTPAPLSSLTVTPTNGTIKVGQTQQHTAMATYTDASTADITTQVTWTSDSPGVATVDASGKVTAVSPGTAHITASVPGAMSSATTVTVSASTPIGIAPAPQPASRPGSAGSAPGSGASAPNSAPVPAPTGR